MCHLLFNVTVVWEIFIRDNLVVKFIRCVIFLWVSYTHENILLSNFVHTEISTYITLFATMSKSLLNPSSHWRLALQLLINPTGLASLASPLDWNAHPTKGW